MPKAQRVLVKNVTTVLAELPCRIHNLKTFVRYYINAGAFNFQASSPRAYANECRHKIVEDCEAGIFSKYKKLGLQASKRKKRGEDRRFVAVTCEKNSIP